MRAPKYHNRKTVVDGITFASMKEARRYGELKLLERAGQISELVLQPRFKISLNKELICTYVADFSYREKDSPIVEDTKGVVTPVFRIKQKLMRAVLGIEVLVT